jgi:hypothetical protein
MTSRPAAWLAGAALLLGTGLYAAPGNGAGTRPVEFESELVCIHVGTDSVEIEGFYRFRVRPGAPAAFTILYPYPDDPRLGGARTVRVDSRVGAGPWSPVAFREAPGLQGSFWSLPTGAGDSLEVRGLYRQALRGRYARYIVTSTANWSRPLRFARFEITLPPRTRPSRFSHPFRRPPGRPGAAYVWEAREFLPDRDIEVEWRP